MQSANQTSAQGDATALITRVLEVNKPWLDPKPMEGTYRLWQRGDNQNDNTTGPFSLSDDATNGWEFCKPYRVGSMVWTPLHVMARKENPYTLSSTWSTNWNHLDLIAFDVTFSNAFCAIGMGGQGNVSYSSASYGFQTARLHIEPMNAVPVYMQTRPSPTNAFQFTPTWQFDPLFYQVDGGLAPRSLDWYESSAFMEHQEFQSVGNAWLFKRGDAWWGANNDSGYVGHIQTLELVDLHIPIPMAATTVGQSLVISLPPGIGAGFGLDSADRPEGPWLPVGSENLSAGASIAVPMPRDKAGQFYRLRK